MDERKITKKDVEFLYEGLKVFYPAYFEEELSTKPIVLVYKGIKRSTFVKHVLTITDTNDVRDAIAILLRWKGMSDQELAETVPPEIAEMVEKLEKAPEKDEKDLNAEIEALRARAQKVAAPKPSAKGEVLQKIEENIPPVRIEVSPSTAKGVADFAIRFVTFPLRTLVNLGSWGLAKTNPGGTTGAWLATQGITYTNLTRAVYKAREQGIYIEAKKIDALLKLLKEQENLSLFSLLASQGGDRKVTFTQAEVGQIGMILYPTERGYELPQETYGQAILGGLAKGIAGNVASSFLSNFVAKAAAPAVAAAIGQTAIPVPVLGAVIGFATSKLKDFWSWIKRQLREPEKLFKSGFVLLAGGLFIRNPIVWGAGLLLAGAGLLLGGPQIAKASATQGARFVSAFTSGVLVPAIGVPTIIALIAVPAIVAFILFIINSGAYIVPGPSAGTVFAPGEVPPGCPAQIWPVDVSKGQKYYVSQGPGGWCSHGPPLPIQPESCPNTGFVYAEAVDIDPFPRGSAGPEHLVIATHPGVVIRSRVDTYGGNYVHIKDNCGGEFITNYVHLLVVYFSEGQKINTGDIIGVMGQTGFASGVHLHYEFKNADGSYKNRDDNSPFLTVPYVPQTVPAGCVGETLCNLYFP